MPVLSNDFKTHRYRYETQPIEYLSAEANPLLPPPAAALRSWEIIFHQNIPLSTSVVKCCLDREKDSSQNNKNITA